MEREKVLEGKKWNENDTSSCGVPIQKNSFNRARERAFAYLLNRAGPSERPAQRAISSVVERTPDN